VNCKRCHKDTHVIDSRPYDRNTIKRRRACLSCGYRFNTIERAA
jgi:transcriptional repressor NrdR